MRTIPPLAQVARLKTVRDAVEALKKDKLGTVYYNSGGALVATAFGAGTFTLKEWKAGGGYSNSQERGAS